MNDSALLEKIEQLQDLSADTNTVEYVVALWSVIHGLQAELARRDAVIEAAIRYINAESIKARETQTVKERAVLMGALGKLQIILMYDEHDDDDKAEIAALTQTQTNDMGA